MPSLVRTPRILVVEGSATQALVVCSVLRNAGYDVVQSLAELRPPAELRPLAGPRHDVKIDLVIAEPKLEDPALATLLQSMLANGVAWLALMPSDAGHAAAAAADASAWVRKPVVPQQLRDAVASCLARQGPAAPLTKADRPGQRPASRAASGLDLAGIADLWGGPGNASFHRVAAVFMGEMEQRLTALDTAFDTHDRGVVMLEAHSIGSAAASVGCAGLSGSARRLETVAEAAPWPELAGLKRDLAVHAANDLRALADLVGIARG